MADFGMNEYSAEAEDIARRRRYAEMLQQQSMQPLESQTAGGWVIPTSPLQGVAKMVQAYSAKRGLEKATEQQKALGERMSGDASTRLAQALKLYQGTPGQAVNIPGNEMGDDPVTQTAAQKPDPVAAAAMLQGNPMTAPHAQMLVAQMLKGPESRFGKVDAKDYTPDSILKFNSSGNYADLVPVRKKEVVNTGGAQIVIDPYAAQTGSTITNTNSPDALLRNAGEMYRWGNINPYQQAQLGNERAGLGLRAQQVGFEAAKLRDEGVLPGAGGGMAPKDQRAVNREIATDRAKMDVKRDFNMGGINAAIDEAERILKKGSPTSSYVGAGLDAAGTVIGVGTKGGAQADQLKSIAGTLVAKMPRMEGPQSDKDVQLYREMAGNVGDNTMPISRRLAALKTVRELYGKYEKQQGGGSGLKFLGFE